MYTPTAAYNRRKVAGWDVRIAPEAREHGKEFAAAETVLKAKLEEIQRVVPADKVALLRQVPFWLEWRAKERGAAEYHPSVDWLRENGYNPEKAKCIEINNAVNFVDWQRVIQPMMVLHELSHAFHDRWLGGDYAPIQEAFENAVRTGMYEKVPHVQGENRRAYGMNNVQEFFAELSEAYFGKNDIFPFTREELRRFDPISFAAVERAWQTPASRL